MPEVDSSLSLRQDTLFAGELICRQPVNGYRFSVDAVLAAQFVLPQPGGRILDLGCGCGVIGLILAYRVTGLVVHGLEVQSDLAELARGNIRANGFTARMQIYEGDVRDIARQIQPEIYDQVVCNPPYGTAGDGRISRNTQAAIARHALNGTLTDFIAAAAYAVRNRGRVVFIYPARRGVDLLQTLVAYRLIPKRMQPIYSFPGSGSARLLLVEAVKNGGQQLELLAPFYIYQQQHGAYSADMQALYEGNRCLPR